MKNSNKSVKNRGKILLVATWVLITLLSYLPPLLNPVHFKIGIFVLIAYPIVLTLNFLLLMWLLYKGSYIKSVLVVILIISGWPLHSKLVSFSTMELRPMPTDLKMVTFNANYGYGFNSNSSEADRAALAALLTEYKKPDIFCLQEYAAEVQQWMDSHLSFSNTINNYPYRTAIFTDHEVLDRGFFSFENYENSAVWADISIPELGIVRIYNIHLQSNQVTDDSRRIQERGLEFDDETIRTLRGILGNYQYSAAKRVGQIDKILKHANESPYPVVIAGDLNDVPISYVYRKIARDRKDTFREKGSGLGISFTGPIPFLRIDFIFSDRDFQVLQHKLLEGEFSDHKPVSAWLRKN